MSLQSAAAGFGIWCERKDIKFNVPLLGNINIGSKREDVMKNVASTCQKHIEINYKGRETIYKDETGDVLSFSVIGIYISEIKFNGAAYQIPQNMIYTFKGKSYLSNICIEGHMIWIKNMNEIKLKSVKDVPCIGMTLEDLGGKIEHVGKRNTERFLEAESEVRRVSSKKQSIKSNCEGYVDILIKQKQRLETDIRDLEARFRGLKSKVYEKQNLLKRYEDDYDKALNRYTKTLRILHSSYEPGWSGFRLEELVNKGKLKKDKFGAYNLVEDSREKTYYTEEDAVDIENTSHPRRGERIISRYEYKGTGFSPDYTVAHNYKKKVIHEDEAYKKARDWCSTQDYKHYHRQVEETYNKLTEIKEKVGEAGKDWDRTMRSPEYISLCCEYERVKKDLESKRKELEIVMGKLYKKG